MIKSNSQWAWPQWAPLPLRLALGIGMVQAGFPKLFIPLGQANITHLISELGIPFPQLVGWIVGLIEFVGGFAILVGALMAIAAGLNAISVVVLLILSFLRGGIPEPLPGGEPFPDYQLAALILAGMLTLAIGGAGTLSLQQTSTFLPRKYDTN